MKRFKLLVFFYKKYFALRKWFSSPLDFKTKVRMLWIREKKFGGKYWDCKKLQDEFFLNHPNYKYLAYDWKFDLFGPKKHGLICYYVYDNEITRWLGFKEENDKARMGRAK